MRIFFAEFIHDAHESLGLETRLAGIEGHVLNHWSLNRNLLLEADVNILGSEVTFDKLVDLLGLVFKSRTIVRLSSFGGLIGEGLSSMESIEEREFSLHCDSVE